MNARRFAQTGTLISTSKRRAPLPLMPLAAEGLAHGDDLHSRTHAANAALVRRLHASGGDAALANAIDSTPLFFLTLWMAHTHSCCAPPRVMVKVRVRALAGAEEPLRAFAGVLPPGWPDAAAALLGPVHPVLARPVLMDARRVVDAQMPPCIALAKVAADGERGFVGRGLYPPPLELFARALEGAEPRLHRPA